MENANGKLEKWPIKQTDNVVKRCIFTMVNLQFCYLLQNSNLKLPPLNLLPISKRPSTRAS